MDPDVRWRYPAAPLLLAVAARLVVLSSTPVSADWVTEPDGIQWCWLVAILRDHANGWPAACLDLEHDTPAVDAGTCGAQCQRNIQCSAWQYNNDTGCYWGKEGHSCEERAGDSSFHVVAGQRLQHGVVVVVRNTRDLEAGGLLNLGVFESPNSTYNTLRCKHICYSDVSCHIWQYGRDGCWVERPPAYQFDGSFRSDSDWARTMIDGEQIRHVCPTQPVEHAEAHRRHAFGPRERLWDAWSRYGTPQVVGPIVGVFAGCCCLCLCRRCCSRRRRTPSSRESFGEEEEEDGDEETEEASLEYGGGGQLLSKREEFVE